MEAKQTLAEYAVRVEAELARYFDSLIPETRRVAPEALESLMILKEYTLRKAKRLRAALVYYTYRMFGGKDADEALRVSMFIELIQSYLLIHDDVMDQDLLRRGKPTVHTIYKEFHQQRGYRQDALHFGESQAINAGDVACHLALGILSSSNFSAENKIKAITKLHKQIATVGYGQILDVYGSVQATSTESDVMRVHHFKTATYTYETPMFVGALLAGATDRDTFILSDYAIPAGIAFQIQDDILGMFGDEDKLGKANDSDLREGKHTLLIVKALQRASQPEIDVIENALGNPELTDQMADAVRDIVIKTGSLEYSKQLAIQYVKQAKAALAVMPGWNGEGRAFLDGIADYMINREF
jgi:geranylgeranyl diphosphate synthase type I